MWVLLAPGDAAMVPTPSYPIHIWGPILAGAEVRHVRLGPEQDFFENLLEAWEDSWPRPRVIVLSFPHNPTTACVDLGFMTRMVDFARDHDVLLVHDFAYADLGFDGYDPPSILQVPGASDVAVELYTLTKSFSMAGWRVGFLARQRRGRRRAQPAEDLPRLRHVPADPDRVDRRDERGARLPARGERDLPPPPRRARRRPRPRSAGRSSKPRGTMFVWAPIPEPYEELGSLEFSKLLVEEAKVAVSPGVGFGPGRGGVRAVRARGERAPHRPGGAGHPPGAHQARLTPEPAIRRRRSALASAAARSVTWRRRRGATPCSIGHSRSS